MNLRSALYLLARLLGDANAIARGRFLQREVRKSVLRAAGGFINKLLR